MPTQVIMPQLGESVIEGTVSKWLKAIGDRIDENEPLLEVNTDKVDSEIPSPASGVLVDILVPEGATVQAGTPLAVIGAESEAAPEDRAAPEAAAAGKSSKSNGGTAGTTQSAAAGVAGAQFSTGGQTRDLGFISPVVAKIASEQKIDLTQVPGTGQGGRITKKDVLAFIEKRKVTSDQGLGDQGIGEQAISDQRSGIKTPKTQVSPAPLHPSTPAPSDGEILPLTPVRRAIAEHMVFSKHTSPHVTTVMEVDLSRVVAHRQANKDAFGRDGANLTFTAYFVFAVVSALKAYPIVNSSWSEDGIQLHRQINIGMATSMGEAGLIVPVIKNADQLSLLGIAGAVNDLASRARAHQLKPDEVKGGTFTITNHGTSGSLFATPIINQPQCAILGAGAIQKRVVVVSDPAGNDALAIRPMAYISLTFDHRILDGAIGDTFLGKVVELLQNWNQ